MKSNLEEKKREILEFWNRVDNSRSGVPMAAFEGEQDDVGSLTASAQATAGEPSQPENGSDLVCGVCTKAYTYKTSFQKHVIACSRKAG